MPDLDPAALAAAVRAACDQQFSEAPRPCDYPLCRCTRAKTDDLPEIVSAALLAYLSADPRAVEIAALRAQVAGMREALELRMLSAGLTAAPKPGEG